jgi:Flp pilus assembly protein TadG
VIVLPLLLIIMAGIFDVGRAMQNYVVILNASREAALAGASAETPVANLVSLIEAELQRGGLDPNRATISIEFQQKGLPAEEYVTVTVGYQVELFFGNFGVPDLPMRAVHEMVAFW